jgi:hypothetical protein
MHVKNVRTPNKILRGEAADTPGKKTQKYLIFPQ